MSKSIFSKGLHGESVHVDPTKVFDDLSWEKASEKVENMPYTIGQILHHMSFWQDFILELVEGNNPTPPKDNEEDWAIESFPAEKMEWETKVAHFKDGVLKAEELADKNLTEKNELFLELVMHNSYHAAQVVIIRRILGEWDSI